ncbi:MAG TPA: DUF3488 and transglutaminase-like domain-containing protein [Streptosporangiaceae bacterium]|nr:DUF3488 and transglutaminase-like domain-containing protein [Streptosporangiaceae bacterium]
MNHRLTAAAAAAVIFSSVSLFAVIRGSGWFCAGAGAVIIVALAATVTRLRSVPAAAGAAVCALLAGYPLLASGDWRAVALGGLIVVVAAASVTRLGLLRALAAAITYLGALLWYLNLAFASRESAAGIAPTTASLRHLGNLAGQGLAEQSFAPPVPGRPGIALLAAGGIGLIAAATDLISVRLRSPAIAGLPLLVLFSVPVTTHAKDAGLGEAAAFCLGITGFLAMLAADSRQRLRLWGRLVTVRHGSPEPAQAPDTRALSTSGRRIGLAAVSVAVIAPLILPSLAVHDLFHDGQGPGNGTGGPSWFLSRLPQPLAQLQGQLANTTSQPVLTYQTQDADAADHYLQVFVLNLDGSDGKWDLVPPASGYQPASGQRSLLPAAGLTTGIRQQSVRIRIKMAQVSGSGYGGQVSFLPLPYAPWLLRVPGDWREDDATQMVYSGQSSLRGMTFSVTSKVADPTRQQLNDGAAARQPTGQQAYLSFPGPQRAALRRIALGITSRAKTPYERALALQNWFVAAGRFRYTLHPDLPNTGAALLDFLTRDRRGYCQQFAVAMADLARLLGIPSRIAVGYTGGIQQTDTTWQVTSDDAHAWPELYFQGAGWLRFEPTPGGIGGQGTASQPSYASPTVTGRLVPPPAAGGTSPGPGQKAGARGHGGTELTGGTGSGPAGPARSRRTGLALPLALAAVIAAALAAIGPGTARVIVTRRRWRQAHGNAGAASAAWRELSDDLDDLGVGVRPSESPRALASRIESAHRLPDAARDALRRVSSAVERSRYAAEPGPAGTLRADVTAVRAALAQQVTRGARWRARLLPASTLGLMSAGLRKLFDSLGGLNAPRMRSRRSPGSA